MNKLFSFLDKAFRLAVSFFILSLFRGLLDRGLLGRLSDSFIIMSFPYVSLVPLFQTLLGKVGRVLFFLVGASFLLIILTVFISSLSAEEGDTPSEKGDTSFVDTDGDGVMNRVDIDDDGDGLIEIATAEDLYRVRYALKGDGIRSWYDTPLNSAGLW